jgi:hypothetical protein
MKIKKSLVLLLMIPVAVGVFAIPSIISSCSCNKSTPKPTPTEYIAKLTLNNSDSVYVLNDEDFQLLCNPYTPEDKIIINNIIFFPTQINGFDFGIKFDLESIPDYFLRFSNIKEITLPSCVRHIGDEFLYENKLFNSPINLDNIDKIGNNFMRGCINFNHSLNLSKVTELGAYFLTDCTFFNSELKLPEKESFSIPNSFL